MYPDVWECINDCAILDGPAGRESVNRGVSQVAQGTAQTNGIESLCAMLKYSDQGTYHKMSAKHFGRYANERSDHSLVRMSDTLASQELTLSRMSGRRPRCRDHVESSAGQAGQRAITA